MQSIGEAEILIELAGRDDTRALADIKGLGEKTAAHILNELRDSEVAARISGLRQAGLNLKAEKKKAPK